MKNNLLKISNYSKRLARRQAGMTYVELIVVLTIFGMMASVVMFNYGDFQARVDIKNLANQIALKVVEAQKSALSGKFTTLGSFTPKPAYGVYFNIAGSGADDKSFVYFADLNNDGAFVNSSGCAGECLDKISIAKGNFIEKIEKCAPGCSSVGSTSLAISFKRPDSSAIFIGASVTGSDYIQITVKSPRQNTGTIKIYPSGRVQVN